jgi:5-methylcytosine-specific restriction endonuclease McrA
MPFKDPEKRSADNIARGRAWRAANPDRVKAWQEANKDRKAATRKAYFQTPRGQALRNVAASHHRAHKGHATPPWQPREELDAIWMACPEGHHVDHIHPLKGKLSSGLDVSWNLQYLPASINTSKSNKRPAPGVFDWWTPIEAQEVRAAGPGEWWPGQGYEQD